MKKILIFAMLLLMGLLVIHPTYAAVVLVDEPSVNTGGLWHVEDGNRVYVYMRFTDGESVIETGDRTNLSYPTYDYSNYTFWYVGSEQDFAFANSSNLKQASISNPDPSLYDKFVVEIVANMLTVAGDTPTSKVIETYNTAVSDITIDLHDFLDRPYTNYLYDYSYLTLTVDGDEILSSRNSSSDTETALGITANPYYLDLSFGVRMYFEKEETATPIDPGTEDHPWDALPLTQGNPTNPVGDWGRVTELIHTSSNVSFNIEYLGTIYPVTSFSVEGDLSFMDQAHDMLYYSDPLTEDRMLYFNFGETLDSAILASMSFENINLWKGEALWNLTQNEIKVTDVRTMYNYIPEVDEDGNVYSYFYMPEVPIDNLISVTALLAYRYWNDGFLGIGEPTPGEVQYKTVTATQGLSSSVNPTWVESTYQSMYLTAAITTAATLTGIIPGYGWVISGAFLLAGAVLNIADVNEWFAYDIDQIQHVIPDTTLTNEINTYIESVSGDFSFNPSTDQLYKLHLATLSDGDQVQVMGDLSNVTQVVWETDGQIYLLQDENIYNPSWGGPGTVIPSSDGLSFDLLDVILVGIGAIVVIKIGKELKLHKKPMLSIAIIGAILFYILYQLGMINI